MAAKKETKVAAPVEAESYKYGLNELVEATGLKDTSIRVGLRDSDFERTGRKWGWNTKAEFEEVVKFFKNRATRRPTTIAKAEPAPKTSAKPARTAKAKATEPAPKAAVTTTTRKRRASAEATA